MHILQATFNKVLFLFFVFIVTLTWLSPVYATTPVTLSVQNSSLPNGSTNVSTNVNSLALTIAGQTITGTPLAFFGVLDSKGNYSYLKTLTATWQSPVIAVDIGGGLKPGTTYQIAVKVNLGSIVYYITTFTTTSSLTNGKCGATAQTCSAGTAASVADNGKVTTWSCTGNYGGTNASCSIPDPVKGACGTTAKTCSAGTAASVADNGKVTTWSCTGYYGGTNASCSIPDAIKGACGTAAKTCSAGTAASVADNGKVTTWSCTGYYGGTNASCSIPDAIKGACGTAAKTCSAGTAASVADNGKVTTWSCTGYYGGTNASCSIPDAIKGACGTAAKTCSAGTAASVADNGKVTTWSCTGNYGGTNAACSIPDAIKGACGATAQTCSAGTAANVADNGTTTTWSCTGSNGGAAAACSIPDAIKGACGATAQTCSAGTAANVADNGTTTTWSCTGSNGGAAAACSIPDAIKGACGATAQTCSAGTAANVADNGTTTTWSCTGSNGGAAAACSIPDAIKGACGATAQTCSAGTAANVADNGTTTTWSCTGSNGGAAAACSIPDAIKGACGATAQTCSAGTAANVADNGTTTTWSCTGSNGGAAAACSIPDPAKGTGASLASFQLVEPFGQPWPYQQPIEFRYDGGNPGAIARMIGPDGVTEVPFQWVSSCSDATASAGCIVVLSNLPANANYTWTLQSSSPTVLPPNPVKLDQGFPYWQMSNGLTGIYLIAPAANPNPYNIAPIQGILLPNGLWTGANSQSPNLLYSESKGNTGCIGCGMGTPMYTVTGYTAKVVDQGPLKTVIQANYTFNRPAYSYGSNSLNTSGTGHYTITLTLYANSKSVLVDEDSDMQFQYFLPLYAELMPDTIRYRGHDSIGQTKINGVNQQVEAPGCGYEANVPVTGASGSSPVVIFASPPNALSAGQVVLLNGVGIVADGNYYVQANRYVPGQFSLYYDANLTKPVASMGSFSGTGTVKPAYRGQSLNPTPDAFLDITYDRDRPLAYVCYDTFTSSPLYNALAVNYPTADHAAGWYYMMYQSGSGPTAPVVGVYTGRASQQITSAIGPSMPGPYSSNNHWITHAQAAGFQVPNLLRGPANTTTKLVHRNWAIWASTQADLLDPALHQPIADEQNSLASINLSHLYTYTLNYPDPPGGWQWLYLHPASASQLIAAVRNGSSLCGSPNCYYNLLYNSDGSSWGRNLLDMWHGNSTAAVQTALNNAIGLAREIEWTLTQGDNHFGGPLGYYQLGLSTSPETAVLNAILMDSNSTPMQRTTAKAALALFGSIFWDNDWFAIDNNSGDSFGLANQVQQYLQYRTQSAAAASSQPFLASKMATAIIYPQNDFKAYFSPTGAVAGSTHYQGTFTEPLLLNYLNLSHDGILSMASPVWEAYANWELSIQTPPEPRFGNIRKGYSNGDGNTESDVRTGMLANAIYSVNPSLSENLMWAWQQSNSTTTVTEDDQFVTTLAAIDPTIPAVVPQLGSINIPGYHTAERHAFGTPNETAVWFINGGFYQPGGHRHFDDGQVTVYALSAPLAIDWNANLYYPSVSGRFMHDSITLDSELGAFPWNGDQPSLGSPGILLQNPTNTAYAGFQDSTASTGTFTYLNGGPNWTRTVRTMAFNPNYPIIYVTDSFSGANAAVGKTMTWNMMATGAVTTPAGVVTPITRFSPGCQTPAGQLPSNGAVFGLNAQLEQFTFTGVTWPSHWAKGIDWDLYLLPTGSSQQFLIGNWGHGCQDTRDAGEFQKANGAPFAETQHILRVHDIGNFTTIIMPYAKTAPPSRTVSQKDCGTQIVQGAETTCFNASAATYANGTENILSVYDNSSQTMLEITAAGGPQEVIQEPNIITWTLSGASGVRSLTLPAGNWKSNNPAATVPSSGSVVNYSYSGGLQSPAVTITFTE